MATVRPVTINSTAAITTPIMVLRSTEPLFWALTGAIVEMTSLIDVVSVSAEVDSLEESVVSACVELDISPLSEVVGCSFWVVVVVRSIVPSDVVAMG